VQWLRVIEGHDPDVPVAPGNMRVEIAGRIQQAPIAHFEITERAKQLIMVVDDDAVIRRTLQIALSNAGYDVLQAGDGEEATRLWDEVGPDLILTDIHMPRKSGLLLIQDLQTHGSSTPIIAMTDGGPTGNLTLLGMAKLLGSVRTMAKPYTLDDMVNAVNQELSRWG
jgi:DNA-binding response OmpR family regulator